jgi:CRISPR/Cas system-associated exonuclease Cas4 (RecB family)
VASSLEVLFDNMEKKVPGAIMQVLLYCRLYAIAHPNLQHKLMPLIYRVRYAFSEFVPTLEIAKQEIASYDDVKEEYEKLLDGVLEELFDKSKPFVQKQVIEHCEYCDFKTICKRN